MRQQQTGSTPSPAPPFPQPMRYNQQWSQQQQQPQWPQQQYPQYPQYQPYPPQTFPQQAYYPYQHQPPPQPPPPQPQQPLITSEEDKQRLFNVCKTGRGNAHLLHEALVYAKPTELKQQGLIQEFVSRCRASLELIYSQIPWATSEAARSRTSANGTAETTDEQLLAALLGANEELLDAIKMYEELERAGQEQDKQERKVQERKIRALEALAAYKPTSAESAVIRQVFDIGDTQNRGVITSHAAAKIFMGSKLSPKSLAVIWEIANVEESDVLSRECIGAAIRLIGHAQKLGPKGKLDEGLLATPGPVPVIEGLDVPAQRPSIPQGGPSYGYLPPLTPQDRNKFMKIFFNCGPKNGVLGGDTARELFMRSKLNMEQLAQVWDLADRNQCGYLDSTGFIVAMYLIQATMTGQLMSIPSVLPPAVYQAASSKTDVFNPNPTSWIEGLTFNSAPSSGWSSSSSSLGASSSSSAGFGSSSTLPLQTSTDPFSDPPRWEVSPQTKATADEFFVLLDENGRGSIDLETARAHLTQPGITSNDLSRIWNLADVNGDNRLSQDEFAVVLHLIERTKLGHPIPRALPDNLVPPATRPGGSSSSSSQAHPSLEEVLIDLRDIHISPSSNSRHNPTSSLPSINEQSSTLLNPSGSLHPTHQRHSQPPGRRPSPAPIQGSHSRSVSVPAVPRQPPVATPSPQPPPAPPATPADWDWDITPTDKARSDKFFDTLDPWKTGNIDGDAAVPFLSKSKLPDLVLAHIWDLSDRDSDGKLSKEDFAVAMYLIREKMSGKNLPDTLPRSLIPPSERAAGSKPLPPAPEPEAEEIFGVVSAPDPTPPPDPTPAAVPVSAPAPTPARTSTPTLTSSRSRTRGPRPAPAAPPPPASPEPPPPPPHDVPLEDDEPRSDTPPPPYTESDDLDLLS